MYLGAVRRAAVPQYDPSLCNQRPIKGWEDDGRRVVAEEGESDRVPNRGTPLESEQVTWASSLVTRPEYGRIWIAMLSATAEELISTEPSRDDP
jgi:hypothetical protein